MKLTIHRMFILVPALAAGVFAAGCGSQESPSTPSGLVSLAPAEGGGEVSTLAAQGCRNIGAVRLERLPTGSFNPLVTHVRAAYVSLGGTQGCSVAPEWFSRPAGLIAPTRDPFVVAVKRSAQFKQTQVSAEAPNGVRGEIQIRW